MMTSLMTDRDSDIAAIPSNYSRLIGRELELQVRDLPKLLRFTSLSAEQFMQEDTLLTPRQQIQILANGLQLSAYADFGLRLGKRLTPLTHGAMGFLASSSSNLLLALKAFQTFLPTRISFARLQLSSHADELECRIYFDAELSPNVYRALSETCAVVFFACAEFIIGRPLHEAQVSFVHAAPDYAAHYADYLAGRYTFSAPCFRMQIPMAACHIPNASANPESYALAMQQCEKMLAELHAQKHSIAYQVQKMMLSHPQGTLSEDDAAAALFMSKRTLARRLQQEGTAYRQLREKLLAQQASDYLRHSDISIDAIAALLNYHDNANFRRAFKRWYGLSPSEYRAQHITEDASC